MSVFEKIKTGLEESISYEHGTIDAKEKRMSVSPEKCPCKKTTCKRFGNCVECRKHHADLKKPVACEKEKKSK